MGWLELVVPAAAVLALFLGIALLVQSIRHGRAIRRLEERLAEQGDAATRASLERIVQLQARASTSTGSAPRERNLRPLLLGGAIALLVVVIGAGAFWFLSRGDDGDAAAQDTPTTQTTRTQAPPDDGTTVPEELPPLENKSQYSVAVFNASGVQGAARERVRPAITAEGYADSGVTTDAPDGTSDLAVSVVMYSDGNKRVGQQLATDLGIERAIPIEGLTDEQTGGADAVVMIGQDLASG